MPPQQAYGLFDLVDQLDNFGAHGETLTFRFDLYKINLNFDVSVKVRNS